MNDKPYAPACDRNRDPILAVLREHFADRRSVLEIGSGTGQHAVHFAAAMPWLTWQCADVAENLPGIRLWLDDAALPNTPAPIELDVRGDWPQGRFDAMFSANTLHIMGWPEVESFFAGVDRALAGPATSLRDARDERDAGDGVLAVYGPFNYGGAYTSASNRDFDGWLKARDPASGIRDFEAVDALARGIGLQRVADVAMAGEQPHADLAALIAGIHLNHVLPLREGRVRRRERSERGFRGCFAVARARKSQSAGSSLAPRICLRASSPGRRGEDALREACLA